MDSGRLIDFVNSSQYEQQYWDPVRWQPCSTRGCIRSCLANKNPTQLMDALEFIHKEIGSHEGELRAMMPCFSLDVFCFQCSRRGRQEIVKIVRLHGLPRVTTWSPMNVNIFFWLNDSKKQCPVEDRRVGTLDTTAFWSGGQIGWSSACWHWEVVAFQAVEWESGMQHRFVIEAYETRNGGLLWYHCWFGDMNTDHFGLLMGKFWEDVFVRWDFRFRDVVVFYCNRVNHITSHTYIFVSEPTCNLRSLLPRFSISTSI